MPIPTLRQGSTIGIFSPSTPITSYAQTATKAAELFLIKHGYNIKHGSLFGKTDSKYRSGSITDRVDELNSLIHDSSVGCIMAAAGGYVSTSMLPYIDYEYLKNHPKIIVGHSDVTSILLAIYEKCGFPTFYGVNFVTSFAHKDTYCEYALQAFEKAVNNKKSYEIVPCAHYTDENTDWEKQGKDFEEMAQSEKELNNRFVTVSGGKAEGRLIGGNLDNLSLIYGNPYCPKIQDGDILFFENISEEADFFERIIANLNTFDIFKKIGGLIIGKPKNYDDIGSGKSEIDILSEFIPNPKIPILINFDCGHTIPITTLPIGKTAILDADLQKITIK